MSRGESAQDTLANKRASILDPFLPHPYWQTYKRQHQDNRRLIAVQRIPTYPWVEGGSQRFSSATHG